MVSRRICATQRDRSEGRPARELNRLSKPIALGLFRVLQESLTNIHRHSDSVRAEIALELLPNRVAQSKRLRKRNGTQNIRYFLTTGTHSGVGLAGIRERIRELGGQFSIQRCTPGTLIVVAMPLTEKAKQIPSTSAAD